jgi:hypothetical protein
VLAGIHLRAHEEFLFCAALNDVEEEGVGLPPFLDERTRPAIHVGYPPRKDMEEILRSRFAGLPEAWIRAYFSECGDLNLSPRSALTLIGYAYRAFRSKTAGNAGPAQTEERIRRCLRYFLADIHRNEKDEPGEQTDKDNGKVEEDHDFWTFGERQGSIH